MSQGRRSKIGLDTPNMGRTLKDGEVFLADQQHMEEERELTVVTSRPGLSKKDSKPLKLEKALLYSPCDKSTSSQHKLLPY